MPIPLAMGDFSFGPSGGGGGRPGLHVDPLKIVVAIVVLAVAAFALLFFRFVGESGKQVGESQASVVQQVDRTRDVAAQQELTVALGAASVYQTTSSSYEGLNAAEMAAIEPSLQYTDGPSPSMDTISIAVEPDVVGLAILAPSGTCFYLKGGIGQPTAYGSGEPCTGAAALGATGATW